MQKTKTVSKANLKAKMFEYLREVEKSGESITVTDNNKPVILISAYKIKSSPGLVFSKYQGKVKYFEDLTSPTESEWEDCQ